MKIEFRTTKRHLIEQEDINFIKLIEGQLEKVEANIINPPHTTEHKSDEEFIKLIEDQLEEVDNSESDSEFIKTIEDQLETVELNNQFEMVERDFVNPRKEIALKVPNLKIEEGITKVPHMFQSQKFDEFENTVFLPYEMLLNFPNSNNSVVKFEEDITNLPQVAQVLQDTDVFGLTMLPTYETSQIKIQDLGDGVVMGEDQYTYVTETCDNFNVNTIVTEEDLKYLLGDTSTELIQNGNLMSTSQGYGGAVANYGGGDGSEGEIGSSPCVKYGFLVQVIDGVTIWRWLGSQAQDQERDDRPLGKRRRVGK